MVYMILGMHKSGTTLTAQCLHAAGINMGFDLEEGDEDYSAHKCEGKLLRTINRSLLGIEQEFSLNTDPVEHYHEIASNQKNAERLISEQNAYSNWGMKHPLQVFTYSFWKQLLPEHKIIFIYRSPELVAQHYCKMKSKKKNRNYWQALKRWYQYNQIILKIIAKTPKKDVLILSYDALLTDDTEFRRLENFIGQPLVDCRKKRERNHQQFQPKRRLLRAPFYRSFLMKAKLRTARKKNIAVHGSQ